MLISVRNFILYLIVIIILFFLPNFYKYVYKERQKSNSENLKRIVDFRLMNEYYYDIILALTKIEESKTRANELLLKSEYLKNFKGKN